MKGKLWATFIPAEPVSVSPRVQQPRGVSIVARDFQTVALYKADGTFAGIRRPDSGKPIEVQATPMLVMGASGLAMPMPCGCNPLENARPDKIPLQVEGMKITVMDIIGSTGLELKVDPGVPWVYAGFAGSFRLAVLSACLTVSSHDAMPCALEKSTTSLHYHARQDISLA